jgi:hypothetical protein
LWVLGLFIAAFAVQTARVVWSYRYLRGIKARAHRPVIEVRHNFEAWVLSCRVQREVLLLVSDEVRAPMAIGFRQPAVVLPARLVAEFDAAQLDHVLLHELAHLARRDDWSNLAARVAAGLLALHPVAALVLRRIEHDREMACDDWVVSMTGEARPYAASLARLFEVCFVRRSMLLAPGMAGSASHLGRRIETLLARGREFAPRASFTRIAICSVAIVGLAAAGLRLPSWFAFAQDLPPAPPAPAAMPAPAALPAPPSALASEVPPAPPAPRPAAAPAPARPAPQAPATPPAAPAAPDRNSFLGALVAAGYTNLSVDDIIRMRDAGINADFLRGIAEAGWGKPSPQELIELHQHGVTPQYIRRVKAAGLTNLNLHDVTNLANHGVRPELVEEIQKNGFGPYNAAQWIEFSNAGVHIELFRALKESGFGSVTPSEILEAAHTGLQARDLREAKHYGPNLTLQQVMKLKRAGVL